MANDAIAPVLIKKQLEAVDRRVNIILKTIINCIKENGIREVVIDDGF